MISDHQDKTSARPKEATRNGKREDQLTRRQYQVVALAAQGQTQSQIARRLNLSSNTVKVHLRLAYRRLGVHSRLNAVRLVHFATCPHCGHDLQQQRVRVR